MERNKTGLLSKVGLWLVRLLASLLWTGLVVAWVAQKLTIPWRPDAPDVGTVLLIALPVVLLSYGAFFLGARMLETRKELFIWQVVFLVVFWFFWVFSGDRGIGVLREGF